MNDNAKTGVFICECGDKIASCVDLKTLQENIGGQTDVAHCETLPFPCLKPGMDRIGAAVVGKKLNRLVVAGCEGRLMLKKFEKEMEVYELKKGQIDMVNIRGHVAGVSDIAPEAKAMKSAKLIKAAVAEMNAMVPSIQQRAFIEGPVMIVGGGFASYAAARELADRGVEFILAAECENADDAVRNLHRAYPGEPAYRESLRTTAKKVFESPLGTILPPCDLTALSGVTGDFTLTFTEPDGIGERKINAGAIISCIDAELTIPGPEFGHDGETVLIQPELEERIYEKGLPKGRIVFWVSDFETGQEEYAELSAKKAWSMARFIRERVKESQTIILHNQNMPIPLSAAERAVNRKLGIAWVPYDRGVRPTIQDGYVTFCGLNDRLEHEINWDMLVLSPVRAVGGKGLDIAKVLNLVHHESKFLSGRHARVRPEMVGREESYLAGSARYPCDLHEALKEGRRAGKKTVEMLEKSKEGALFIPRVVCVADPQKCIGCGQCQELCDCGGIGIADGPGGGLPRVVDPMVCTGGGTCAAACPYHALVLQNNSNEQREARIAALAKQMAGDEVIAYGCSWAGLPAADNAGLKGLKYDPRVHILGVPCVGQLDPCIMARAFLEGSPGLILVGCMPEDCHHSYGVDHAWSRVSVIKKLLTLCGFDRRRIALAHADLKNPNDFIRSVESFSATISAIGPIERTPENLEKLEALYNLIKYNTRVRHLISASLRRPWEDSYRGSQQHALDYDRDFTEVLTEEFMQQRLLLVFEKEKRPFRLQELAVALHEEEQSVAEALWEMVTAKTIGFSHQNSEAIYALNN